MKILCFQTREVNTVLGDVIDHMIPNRCSEKFTSELKAIVRHIVVEIADFEALLSMVNNWSERNLKTLCLWFAG